MTVELQRALVGQVEQLATDVGHLRRRIDAESSAAFVVDRIASVVEWLYDAVQPCAAELVACTFPGDDETADAAIEHVEQRTHRVRSLLGGTRR